MSIIVAKVHRLECWLQILRLAAMESTAVTSGRLQTDESEDYKNKHLVDEQKDLSSGFFLTNGVTKIVCLFTIISRNFDRRTPQIIA